MAIYKDLPLTIKGNPEPVTDKAAIQRALLNIIHTRKGSVPGKPTFGCALDSYVFEQLDSTMKSLLIGDLNTSLTEFEPRISVEDISVEFQEAYNRVDIEVQYSYTMVKTSEYEVLTFSIDL